MNGNEKIVSVLIKQEAGIVVRDTDGKTALDIATDKGYTAITQLLKDRAEGRKLSFFHFSYWNKYCFRER
jgi:ankyrin repeat protein